MKYIFIVILLMASALSFSQTKEEVIQNQINDIYNREKSLESYLSDFDLCASVIRVKNYIIILEDFLSENYNEVLFTVSKTLNLVELYLKDNNKTARSLDIDVIEYYSVKLKNEVFITKNFMEQYFACDRNKRYSMLTSLLDSFQKPTQQRKK